MADPDDPLMRRRWPAQSAAVNHMSAMAILGPGPLAGSAGGRAGRG